MAGQTDLETMLSTLEPTLREGEFVYVSVREEDARGLPGHAMVAEAEGVSLVLRRQDAEAAGLPFDFVASWISLSVHSSLEAVGLTAAFASALGTAGISCNVLAGFYHDHLLVPVAQTETALHVLRDLARNAEGTVAE